MRTLKTIILALGAITLGCLPSVAGDLAVTALVPQNSDSYPQIIHKQALWAAPKLWVNVTSSGTTSELCSALDRVVISSPGASGANIILKDGTNAIATLNTATQGSYMYNLEITSGTLSVVSSGTANLTVTFR